MELTTEYIQSLSGLAPELREVLCVLVEKLAELEAAASAG